MLPDTKRTRAAMTVVTACFLVLLVTSSAAAAQVGTGEISECTDITSSGEYVLVDDVRAEESTCISISADNVVLDGAGHEVRDGGVRVERGADDVTVSNVTVIDSPVDGVYVSPDTKEISIENNGIVRSASTGVEVRTSGREKGFVEISGNTVKEAGQDGIGLGGFYYIAENSTVENNTVLRPSRFGIVGNLNKSMISGNYVEGSAGVGVGTFGAHNVIEKNRVKEVREGVQTDLFSRGGIASPLAYNLTIRQNAVSNSTNGVQVSDPFEVGLTKSVKITENVLLDGENGILLNATVDASEVKSTNNNITGNTDFGVLNKDANVTNATNNYWGHDSGPSGGVEDPYTGELADGSGDKVSESPVEAGVSNVHFDPWTGKEDGSLPPVPDHAAEQAHENLPRLPDVAAENSRARENLPSNTGPEDPGIWAPGPLECTPNSFGFDDPQETLPLDEMSPRTFENLMRVYCTP